MSKNSQEAEISHKKKGSSRITFIYLTTLHNRHEAQSRKQTARATTRQKKKKRLEVCAKVLESWVSTFRLLVLVDAHLVQLLDALRSLLRRVVDDKRRASEVLVASVCRVGTNYTLVLRRLHSNLSIQHHSTSH